MGPVVRGIDREGIGCCGDGVGAGTFFKIVAGLGISCGDGWRWCSCLAGGYTAYTQITAVKMESSNGVAVACRLQSNDSAVPVDSIGHDLQPRPPAKMNCGIKPTGNAVMLQRL